MLPNAAVSFLIHFGASNWLSFGAKALQFELNQRRRRMSEETWHACHRIRAGHFSSSTILLQRRVHDQDVFLDKHNVWLPSYLRPWLQTWHHYLKVFQPLHYRRVWLRNLKHENGFGLD